MNPSIVNPSIVNPIAARPSAPPLPAAAPSLLQACFGFALSTIGLAAAMTLAAAL